MAATNAELKAIHDLMLQNLPAGETHAPCAICDIEHEEDEVDTISTEEHQRVLSEATAAATADRERLEAEVARLTASTQTAEVDQRIVEATAELEAKVTDLQSQADAAAAAQKTAEDALAATLEFLQGEADTVAADALRDERVTAVKETEAFPDAHVEAQADRYAEMTPEVFTATLEEYKELVAARAPVAPGGAPKITPDLKPGQTAITAAADTGDEGGTVTDIRKMLDLSKAGIKVSSL